MGAVQLKRMRVLETKRNCARAVKSDMRAILHINLPSRAQSVVELVPGRPGPRHIRGCTSADQAIPTCRVILFRSTVLFGVVTKQVFEVVQYFYSFDA